MQHKNHCVQNSLCAAQLLLNVAQSSLCEAQSSLCVAQNSLCAAQRLLNAAQNSLCAKLTVCSTTIAVLLQHKNHKGATLKGWSDWLIPFYHPCHWATHGWGFTNSCLKRTIPPTHSKVCEH